MADTQFFDDMWLALDKELSSYDSYLKDADWMSTSTDPVKSQSYDSNSEMNTPNLSVQTYEDLLSQYTEQPSKGELRSSSREERIEAIRQLYNQMPTIIDASSFARIHRVANHLYKTGKVREASALVKFADQTISQSYTYVEDSANFSKSLVIDPSNDEAKATVEIMDKTAESSMSRTFGNVFEAIKFFLHPEE